MRVDKFFVSLSFLFLAYKAHVVYFLYALSLPLDALFLLIYSFLCFCLSIKKKKNNKKMNNPIL